jgi:putative redox protein
MTEVRHVSQASARSAADAHSYRVDLRSAGHDLVADEPVSAGGGATGPTPFGLLLSGLAACTAITLRMYAQRKGWPVGDIDVDVRYDTDHDGNASIARTITVAPDVPQDQRDRLADIAERTPVTLAVKRGTVVATHLEARSTS